MALIAADAGDEVLVGPGYYGDLDRDGVLGEEGEELGHSMDPVSLLVHDPRAAIGNDGGGSSSSAPGTPSSAATSTATARATVSPWIR